MYTIFLDDPQSEVKKGPKPPPPPRKPCCTTVDGFPSLPPILNLSDTNFDSTLPFTCTERLTVTDV